MDHQMAGVTVDQFRKALLDAVGRIDVVQPATLREPVSLWLRSVEAQAAAQEWKHLLGRPVISAWNAARAILDKQ
jgi:hypothetical protein